MQTSVRRTPGVYITELDAFPRSVVGVQTAVPAFIGYTEKALKNGEPILNKPTKITSIDDFRLYFGDAPGAEFKIEDVAAGKESESDFQAGDKYYKLNWSKKKFYLYNCLRFFYENGGGLCYVVSVGDYTQALDSAKLAKGLDAISKEKGPTMLLVPDALLMDETNYQSIVRSMLSQANERQDRVAVLDVYKGYDGTDIDATISKFRENVGSSFLNYGMAYYPWLNTSIVQNNEIVYTNFEDGPDGLEKLKIVLKEQADKIYKFDATKKAKVDALIDDKLKKPDPKEAPDKQKAQVSSASQDVGAAVPLLFDIYADIQMIMNVLPPASAMAGIYTAVDTTRGVWKAPANVAMNAVISPTIFIDSTIQEDLNVPLEGKAVNALRSFPGQGVMVWGARTLDGNSNDYRYINVRRTLIYIEQSLKIAAANYLFEPNDANTWVSVKGMMDNFLMSVWQAGGLMGDKPSDAYTVNVGLGSTMTGQDILGGYMRVQVLLQMLRPAEFIEITFQQKMQGV